MIGRRLGNKQETADPNTVLLLHCEDFSDSSISAKTPTSTGGALVAGKFNNCLYFTGTPIKFADSTDWKFGTRDWTIDFWIKIDNHPHWARVTETGTWAGTTGNTVQIQFNESASSRIIGVQYSFNQAGVYICADSAMASNTWTHFAAVCLSGTIAMYVNGAKQTATMNTVNLTSTGLSVGGALSTDANAPCYLDEFRISNVARWTGNFTPPTAPYDR